MDCDLVSFFWLDLPFRKEGMKTLCLLVDSHKRHGSRNPSERECPRDHAFLSPLSLKAMSNDTTAFHFYKAKSSEG